MIDPALEERLEHAAKETLARNDRGSHTVPHEGNYPHQWLWDSAFTAIGLSHLDPERAATEIQTLLRGQWHNGMVPHQLFTKKQPGQLLPNIDYLFWDSQRSPHAPEKLKTSGITQPPVLAEGAMHVARKLDADDRQGFMSEVVPKLVKYHEWIYRERDFGGNNLMTVVHPYESGMDNSPPWTEQLRGKERAVYALGGIAGNLIKPFRRDLKEMDESERSSSADGAACFTSGYKLRKLRYDWEGVRADDETMQIEDVAVNSILARNNVILHELAAEAGLELPATLSTKMAWSISALDQLWDEETQMYYSRDVRTNKLIKRPTVASLLPIYSGLSTERAKAVVDSLTNPDHFWAEHPVPTIPISSPDFNERNFWCGPTWINMNWLILNGLRRASEDNIADDLSENTLRTLDGMQMPEHYSALTGKPLGVKNFSWTAALTIDLLKNRP